MSEHLEHALESLQDALCGSEGTDDMRSRDIQTAGVHALIAIGEMLEEMLPYFKRELSEFRVVSPEARFKQKCEAQAKARAEARAEKEKEGGEPDDKSEVEGETV